MATYEWFRVYNEILGDQKMRGISGDQFRAWVFLLALANQSDERGVVAMDDPEGLADVLKLQLDELEPTLERFERLRMIERDADGSIVIANFAARQYDKQSDTPEETAKRKQKSRQRKSSQKNPPSEQGKQGGHADVTPESRDVTRCHATDTDTDTYSTPLTPLGGSGGLPDNHPEEFVQFWQAYPVKQRKPATFVAWERCLADGATPSDLIAAARHYADDVKGRPVGKCKLANNFLSEGIWKDYVDGPPDGKRIVGGGSEAVDDVPSGRYIPSAAETRQRMAAERAMMQGGAASG